MDKETENTQSVSINDKKIKDLLRDLVREAVTFNQNHLAFIREYKKSKIKKSKFSFRFPFILKEKHVQSFQECIEKRLKIKYNNEYVLLFICEVEYKNNDKCTYDNMDDLFGATHDDSILRITFNWEYTISEMVNEINIPINFDIIIKYEIEQDSDQREMFRMEEWGGILVEGSDNDWNNATLSELKILTQSTKMPFWWYYPKKAFLAIREYTNLWIWYGAFSTVLVFIIPIFFNTDVEKTKFIQISQQITDVSEKLQAYIEYALKPSDSGITILLYYLLVFVLSGGIALLIMKGSRYVFPKSAILIGSNKAKEENKLRAYSFIWGAVICTIIGIIITLIITGK